MPARDRFSIGIDVGGTNIAAGLVDANHRITARHKIDTEADRGSSHVLQRIADCIDELLHSAKLKPSRVRGVGLAIPGAVDAQKGLVLEAVNLRWTNFKVVEQMRKFTRSRMTLENDVNAGTWGEHVAGAGREAKSLMGVFVGTGIGAGLVLDGKLYAGTFGTAGEIGHTRANPFAPQGLRTLEELASRTAIVNRLVAMVTANHPSKLPKLAGDKWPKLRSGALAKALEANDPLTVNVLRDAAHLVGVAVANAVTLLSLDRVVIGGGLTEALDKRWLQWIRESFNEAVFPEVCRQCRIVASSLGDDAGLLGAAMLAEQRLAK